MAWPERGQHHARPADRADLRRPRDGLRHRRPRHRPREQPHRGDRLRLVAHHGESWVNRSPNGRKVGKPDVLIVADDITGALDTAGYFASPEKPVKVWLDVP